jgi:hypothetical protein
MFVLNGRLDPENWRGVAAFVSHFPADRGFVTCPNMYDEMICEWIKEDSQML